MVCNYGECSFFKTVEEEEEAQKKHPFDKNYQITLAIKNFNRDITKEEKKQAKKEVGFNERIPNILQ